MYIFYKEERMSLSSMQLFEKREDAEAAYQKAKEILDLEVEGVEDIPHYDELSDEKYNVLKRMEVFIPDAIDTTITLIELRDGESFRNIYKW